MRLVVEGCCHGELDQIYESIGKIEQHTGQKIDALLCCGDFQAVRNETDLNCLACPPKYRRLADFHKYWRGEKKAPLLTIFVGGNHEASNYLLDLYYGGWVCENVYYMGHSGCVNLVKEQRWTAPGEDGGDEEFGADAPAYTRREHLRIGGLSGIYNHAHFQQGCFERFPFDEGTKRSAYHVRRFECEKLRRLASATATGNSDKRRRRTGPPCDVFLSHDWPRGIWDYGNKEAMLRRKDRTGQMRADMDQGRFGNPATMELLRELQPAFWFAAHHHCKFPAVVQHEPTSSSGASTTTLPEPVGLGLPLGGSSSSAARRGSMPMPAPPGMPPVDLRSKPPGNVTRFLGLGKCLPGQDFLQVLEISNNAAAPTAAERSIMAACETSDEKDGGGPQTTMTVCFDSEWLALQQKNRQHFDATWRHSPEIADNVEDVADTDVEAIERKLKERADADAAATDSADSAVADADGSERISAVLGGSESAFYSIPFNRTHAPDLDWGNKQREWMNELLAVPDVWADEPAGSGGAGAGVQQNRTRKRSVEMERQASARGGPTVFRMASGAGAGGASPTRQRNPSTASTGSTGPIRFKLGSRVGVRDEAPQEQEREDRSPKRVKSSPRKAAPEEKKDGDAGGGDAAGSSGAFSVEAMLLGLNK